MQSQSSSLELDVDSDIADLLNGTSHEDSCSDYDEKMDGTDESDQQLIQDHTRVVITSSEVDQDLVSDVQSDNISNNGFGISCLPLSPPSDATIEAVVENVSEISGYTPEEPASINKHSMETNGIGFNGNSSFDVLPSYISNSFYNCFFFVSNLLFSLQRIARVEDGSSFDVLNNAFCPIS
ncbi:hypothetical protein QAD02_016276 [Eretmocerus hayati]|uniref:Uncharacterized protein n=1 Tax=Eretmocerus hayati TaxID=131215 RepID=A0ACC2PB07_9HYME|nr:hypothetical protein QAD02_016276 [Eretmocerus hayati]